MNNDPKIAVPQLEGSPPSEPLEQELYAALRAAGASPEDARDCCRSEADAED